MYMSCPRQQTLCKNWFYLLPVRNLQAQLYIVHNTIDSAGIIYYCQNGTLT